MLSLRLLPGLTVLIGSLPDTSATTAMIEPEVTGSGVEDGAEDGEEVMLGAVKVNIGSDGEL